MKRLFTAAALTMTASLVLAGSAFAEPEEAPAEESVQETVSEATDNAVVEVTDGWYLGTKEDGVYRFVGMQYGVAERFHTAVAPEPHAGIHTATTYGNSCPADESFGSPAVPVTAYQTPNAYYTENEDCLYINVWTPEMNPGAKKPVLFFIHGGGFSNGSANELTYYDGAEFAKANDMVFVSVNSRLNVLGYTDLSAYGEEYVNSGNAGQEDLVLALQWVQDNIDQFGGDASNVTLLGQSGGGSKVTSLLSCAPAQGLFSKAILCSGGGAITQTSADSQACGVALVEKTKEVYGVESDEEALVLLETMDYDDLREIAADTGVGAGPTVDGTFIVESPYDPATLGWTSMSDGIPMIISSTIAEMSGAMADNCLSALVNNSTDFDPTFTVEGYLESINKNNMSEEYKQQALNDEFGEDTDAVVEAFLKAYPELEAYDVLRVNRRNNDMAIARANNNSAPTYQVVFAWEFPIFGGQLAWHTGGDLPFIFQNLKFIENQIAGDEAAAQKIADTASALFANFCKTGDPSIDGLAWPAFTAEEGATMIITENSEVRNYHDKELFEVMPSSSGDSAADTNEAAEDAESAEGESAEGESAEGESPEEVPQEETVPEEAAAQK